MISVGMKLPKKTKKGDQVGSAVVSNSLWAFYFHLSAGEFFLISFCVYLLKIKFSHDHFSKRGFCFVPKFSQISTLCVNEAKGQICIA